MTRGISAARATRLRGPLERLYRRYDYDARIGSDAIKFPARYRDPQDREIVALLSASLAYGRGRSSSASTPRVTRRASRPSTTASREGATSPARSSGSTG